MPEDSDYLAARVEALEADRARLTADLRRAEGFGAAAFAFNLSLLRSLMDDRGLPAGDAIDLLRMAVLALRRVYRVGPLSFGEEDALIDAERLADDMHRAQNEGAAEELLRRVLDMLIRRIQPDADVVV